MAKPIPDGFGTLTPYLIVSGAVEAIEFYKKAFGATEIFRMPMPDGRRSCTLSSKSGIRLS